MLTGSGTTAQSLGELSAAVAETVNRLNSLTDSMESMEKWRSEAEKHAKETTKTMASMNNMIASVVEMLNKRLPSEEDMPTPYRNPSKQPIQVNKRISEPSGSDTTLGYQRTREIMPDRDSLVRKLDMPLFDGKHPYGWIARMENFFRVGQYPEHQKLELIALSLEGDVLSWYNGEDRRLPFQSWTELKKRIVSRFGNQQMSTPKQCLAVITQTGSAADYVKRFEEISSLVVGVDDEMLEVVFFGGLKQEMKEIVRRKEPRDLPHMIATVLQMEDGLLCRRMMNVRQTSARGNQYHNFSSKLSSHNNTALTWKTKPLLIEAAPEGDKPQNKTQSQTTKPAERGRLHLSPAEYARRKRDGQCYKCDEKHFYGHVCANKQLQALTVIDGCEVELVEDEFFDTVEENQQGVVTECMSLSFNAFVGLPSTTTTKMWGTIGKLRVVVMLDSGATHNFVNPRVVTQANLQLQTTTTLDVQLGTGVTVSGVGICRDVDFKVANLGFHADFLILELGNVDVILGVQWLRTLGKCQVDWETHELSFVYKGKKETLYGDPTIHNCKFSFM